MCVHSAFWRLTLYDAFFRLRHYNASAYVLPSFTYNSVVWEVAPMTENVTWSLASKRQEVSLNLTASYPICSFEKIFSIFINTQ